MALSGTITGKADNSNYTLTCEWLATQNVTNNTSSITAKVYLKAPSGWSTVSSYWNCTINGTQVTSDESLTVSSTKVLLGQRTWTVNHTSNGTASPTISFSYSNGLSSAGTYTTKSGSGSATVTLNTIPRTSSFSLNTTTGTVPCNFTVNISKASSSFTHTVIYTSVAGTNYTKADKTSNSSVTVDCGIGECSSMPNSTSGTAKITVITYNGSTEVGRTSKNVTLNVPSSVVPTVSVSAKGNNNLGGVSVSGKSTVTITPSGAGVYGSTIKSYSYSGAGLSGTGSSKTTGSLAAGNYRVTVTATDSRGRTASSYIDFAFYDYANPWCAASAFRANQDGSANASGTYVRLNLNWGLSNPGNTNANTRRYQVHWKKSTDSSWTLYKEATLSGYTGSAPSWDAGSGWATTTSYDIKFTVTDSYGSASATCNVSTIAAILDIENAGVGVGKLHERGKLDVAGAVYTSDRYYATGNGKNVQLGTGTSDVYLHNSASGKYLQLKDNGTLAYSDAPILTGTMTGSGKRWGVWANITGDGVMEVGKYIDFHNASGNTSDYNYRLTCDGGTLWGSGIFRAPRMYTTEWFYSVGNTGWYSETYGGGIYMIDSSWVRVYNDKGFYTGGEIKNLGNVNTTGSVISTRSGYQFRARPASEGQVVQYRLEDSSGNHKGYIGSPNGNYELHIQCETNNVLLRGKGIYCKNSSNSAYVSCYASAFTVSSEAKRKKRIHALEKNAMDIINQTVVYEYELKDNTNTRDVGKKTIGLVIDYETPEEIITETEILDDSEYSEGGEFTPGKVKQIDKGIDLYAMSSLAWKALQEKDKEIKDLQDKIEKLTSLIQSVIQ